MLLHRRFEPSGMGSKVQTLPSNSCMLSVQLQHLQAANAAAIIIASTGNRFGKPE